MMRQIDSVNPKPLEECGSHENTDDDFEEYSEEEMPSEEELNENLHIASNKGGSCEKISMVEGSCAEPNVDVSSDGKSAEEVPCGEGSDDEDDDEDSCPEEPNEEDSSDEKSAEEIPCGEGSDDEDSCTVEPNEEGSSDEKSAQEVPCGKGSDDEDSCAVEPNEEGSSDEKSAQEVPCGEGSDDEDSCAEEPNEEGSSDEKSAEEVPCGEGSDDEDSCAEEPNEEVSDEPNEASEEYPIEGTTLEEASDDNPAEDLSFEDISEDELSDESEEEPNEEELLSGSMDQLPLVTVCDEVPSLLEEKKTSDPICLDSKTSGDSSCSQYPRESSNLSTDAIVSKQPDVPLASSKKRLSRWDIKSPILVNDSGDLVKRRKTRWSSDIKDEALVNDGADLDKKRKSRWSSDETENMSSTLNLPDSMKDILSVTCNDPRIQKLNEKLQAIHQKLEGGAIVNMQTEEESSPSPPPIDDSLETTEYWFRLKLLKLLKQKQKIISELSSKSKKADIPKHHSNSDYIKKLYLPLKEYPNYNFAGLILGPKGNTLKKMEKETGATIRLRGKGSRNADKKPLAEHEDMHVMIQSDSQASLDAAVSMVEKLLVPVNDRFNFHKAAQLRELAEIRGTLNEGGLWKTKQCDICGKPDHPTSVCPLTATVSQANTSFHAGSGSLFSSFKSPSLSPCPMPLVAKTYGENLKKEVDPANLYVGFLPQSVSSDKLKELFLPYGSLCQALVIVDKSTGQSKGYGFVKYTNTSDAAKAIGKMNGYMIDGKKLAVRVAGISPPPLNANLPNHPQLASIPPSSLNANLLPIYPGLTVISSNANLPNYPGLSSILLPPSSLNANYPGLAGSILQESGVSFPKNSSNSLPLTGTPPQSLIANLPKYPGYAAISREIPEPNCWPGPPGSVLPESGTYFQKSSQNLLKYPESRSSAYLGSTNELASFPGYLKSIDPSSDQFDQPMPSSSLSFQPTHFIRNFSGNQMNPTWHRL